MQLCICIVHGMVDKTIELACMHVCCDRSVGGQKIEFKTVVNLHFDQNTLPERDKNKIPSSGSQTVKLYANSNVRDHRNVQNSDWHTASRVDNIEIIDRPCPDCALWQVSSYDASIIITFVYERIKSSRLGESHETSIYMTYTNNGDNRVSTAYSTLSLRFFFFFCIFILLFVSEVFRLVYCFMISKGELIIWTVAVSRHLVFMQVPISLNRN